MRNLLLLLLLVVAGNLTAQPKSSPTKSSSASGSIKVAQRLSGLDQYVEKLLKDWNTPGCGIAVVYKDKLVLAEGYGYRDLEKKLPVTSNTLYKIGSDTKLFTAIGAGLLVDEGKLQWDQPIRQYVPSLEFPTEELNRNATLRDLLAHRTGLGRSDQSYWYGSVLPKEVVQGLKHIKAELPFRQRFNYSSRPYFVAGYAIEQLSGVSYPEFIRSRLFEPLGMKNSTLDPDVALASPDYAKAYHENYQTGQLEPIRFWRWSVLNPAGSVISNLNDLSRWLIVQMNGGKLEGRVVLPPAVISETMRPAMVNDNTPVLEKGYTDLLGPVYGAGRGTASYRGHYLTFHGGSSVGHYSHISFMPFDSIGVITFVNARHAGKLPDVLAFAVYDRLLGLERVPLNERFLSDLPKIRQANRERAEFIRKDRITGTHPSHPLAEYAGEFFHPAYGKVRVGEKDGKLRFDYGIVSLPLEHFHYDRFQTPYDADFYLVTLPTSGVFSLRYETDQAGNLNKVYIALDGEEIAFIRQPISAAIR
jgi:CubicO group peptidase (beta-lactamase class C family)